MKNRRIIFLGSTKLSEEILKHLISRGHNIVAIFSIPEFFDISYSEKKVHNTNFSDLSILANKYNIPFFLVDKLINKPLEFYKSQIKELLPDVLIAAGWYYMIKKEIREIPKEGVWGVHASLLPNYAGGAPLVWALINGEEKTGVTLFKMDDGVDDGDIISQGEIIISEKDNIKSLLFKSQEVSKKLLNEALNKETISYYKQKKSGIKIYPQRSPDDGEIDLNWDNKKIIDFVRAQSKPYPGAWIRHGNKKIILWEISIENFKNE
tara:strand:+ start:172 stop:966 length:795 start_codon:yes stop_codon:yes gene_type:complete